MTLRLGFFNDFKWGNSVLLTGTPNDIENLSSELGKFVLSNEQQFPIHSLASISNRYPAMLFAQREAKNFQNSISAQFSWLCASDVLPDIQANLLSLSHSSNGHQYFELQESGNKLIVSVGEYSDSWWQAHG